MLKTIFTLPQTTINFVRSVFAELRLIDWMKPSAIARNTGVVILMVTLLVLFLSGMDKIVVEIRNLIFSVV